MPRYTQPLLLVSQGLISVTTLIVTLLVSLPPLLAQAPGRTCSTAVPMCDGAPTVRQLPDVITDVVSPNDLAPVCGVTAGIYNRIFDTTAHEWLILEASGAGIIAFDLIPEEDSIDLDFSLLYAPANACGTIQAIRCMFSGINIGEDSSMCVGPTGASIADNDFFEGSGCAPGNNNYVAGVEVEAGDRVWLLIANFYATPGTYTFNYTGTAPLNCTVSSTATPAVSTSVHLAPNPASTAAVLTSKVPLVSTHVYDLSGREVMRLAAKPATRAELDTRSLPTGSYHVACVDVQGRHTTKRLVVQH